MYSTDPVRDAARYFDAKDAADAHSLAAYLHYSQEIRDTLTKHIRATQHLSLPYAKPLGGIGYQSVSEVVADEMCDGAPLKALMNVLQFSECPSVAALRTAIANSYIEAHADLVAAEAE